MTQRRDSRIRKPSKEQVLPESDIAAPGDLADNSRTAEIQRRAYEIYLSRNGAPGDPVGAGGARAARRQDQAKLA
jgi:hypothetical protein